MDIQRHHVMAIQVFQYVLDAQIHRALFVFSLTFLQVILFASHQIKINSTDCRKIYKGSFPTFNSIPFIKQNEGKFPHFLLCWHALSYFLP